jgi:hypothetical protein
MEWLDLLRTESGARCGMRRKIGFSATMLAKLCKRRCAIYTRKSNDEGLGKELNSLQVQRDACEAYIESQRSEG